MDDIPILQFTTDPSGNVTYTNSTAPKPATATTGTKWWEQVIGVVPALVTAIFGGNAQAQPTTGYIPTPYAQTSSNNNNLLVIVAVAIVLIVFLMKKK
ncbi:hypothetical protein [Dyadobacter psychrotolerans]|uniref:Uncharacterized protein n=1 Tax=Dyadobacter psychrotolerans TaxID=2541721 RepID=A0A4R5DMC9_9BACT|nr:hypothetical protein [Dyadobacter psychrotolerans]TDE15289.1 hypothetical protein E0F88_12255 [Dyadobacter psychrotolerans]